jgi:DNA-binding transcriptional LysR family regulator
MVRPYLETVHEAAVEAKRLSQDIKQLKRVSLKLGIMSTISPDEIVDLVAALKTRHDGLELRLCDATARELRDRLLAGDLEVVIYALPGEELDERTHVMPLLAEQMVITVHRGHRLAGECAFPVRELNGECYIHRMNCEFAGYADHILKEKGVTCTRGRHSFQGDAGALLIRLAPRPGTAIRDYAIWNARIRYARRRDIRGAPG